MPRKRHRSTAADIRFRNMLEASGLPAMAGRSRLGLKATRPVTESVASDPPERPPQVLHWPGTVSDHVDVRNGPLKFPTAGTLWKIHYVWDTAPSTNATVAYYLDGAGTASWTHTVNSGSDEDTETMSQAITDEHIVAIVTADGGGVGLTAYLYLR